MDFNRTQLTERFTDALEFTCYLHAAQYRKGSGVPYIAHLMSVAALVLEAGGDEDLAIAALLHDAVEDQGGLETLHRIEQKFGSRVAAIVEGCSDTFSQPKPAWRKRKEDYLVHLAEASPEVRLVSLADKLHNARCILRDIREKGGTAFEKFNGGQAGTLWYYAALVHEFNPQDSSYMVTEFTRVVEDIHNLALNAQ